MRVPEKAPDFFLAMTRGESLPFTPADPARMGAVVAAAFEAALGNRYYHWDDLRYRRPPQAITREEFWFGLKMLRLPA